MSAHQPSDEPAPDPQHDDGQPDDEADHRPFPDPTHDITPRKPRTWGGAVYLAMLG